MVAAAFCHDIDHRGTNNLYQTKQVEMFYLMPGGCFVRSFLNSVFNSFSNPRLFNFVGVPILWLNFMAPPSWRGTIWSTARHSWLTRYGSSLDKKSNKWRNKTTDLKVETHMVWPLFTVSSRDWTSSATFRSASLSMCSTCLTSASLPLIWPFTSSRLSEIHFWISSMCLSPPCPPFWWLSLCQFVCTLLGPVAGLTGCLTHLTLFFLTQKKNHVPEHCECHRANDRWEGGHFLCVQQRHQEGNRHVRDLLQQDIMRLLSQLCPVYFKMYFCGLKKAAADLCKWSASVAGCHLLSPVCLAPPGPWWWQAVTCLL